jgi:hypothetical protein
VSELLLSGGLAQTLELAAFLIVELERSSLLHDPSLVHGQDLGAWHNCLALATENDSRPGTTHSKSVGNDENGDTLELIMDHSRDLGIGGRVDTCGSFIQDQQLVLVQ